MPNYYNPTHDGLVLAGRHFYVKWVTVSAFERDVLRVLFQDIRLYARNGSVEYHEKGIYPRRRFFPGFVFDVGVVTDTHTLVSPWEPKYDLWLRFKPHPSPDMLLTQGVIYPTHHRAELHRGVDNRIWLQIMRIW